MEADELWVECYQGEVLGESLFSLLAEREADPDHRRTLEVLTMLERSTKELAMPVLEKRSIGLGDTEATIANSIPMADAVRGLDWEAFLGSFEPVISQFLAKYRRLVELASDDTERVVAERYVAHELALEAFLRRELGADPGDPLEPILSLPHVAAASA